MSNQAFELSEGVVMAVVQVMGHIDEFGVVLASLVAALEARHHDANHAALLAHSSSVEPSDARWYDALHHNQTTMSLSWSLRWLGQVESVADMGQSMRRNQQPLDPEAMFAKANAKIAYACHPAELMRDLGFGCSSSSSQLSVLLSRFPRLTVDDVARIIAMVCTTTTVDSSIGMQEFGSPSSDAGDATSWNIAVIVEVLSARVCLNLQAERERERECVCVCLVCLLVSSCRCPIWIGSWS
jgi:hypothetical protein